MKDVDDRYYSRKEQENNNTDSDLLDVFDELDQELLTLDQEISDKSEDEKIGDWKFIAEVLETFRLMNSSLDLKSVLEHVMDSAVSVIRAERGFLVLKDSNGNLEYRIARDSDRNSLTEGEFKVSQSFLKETIRTKQFVYVEDVLTEQEYSPSLSIQQLKLRSIVCCPMIINEDLVGVIYADSSKPLIGKSKTKKQLFQLFADQAADAIRNAQYYERLKKSYEQLQNAQESLLYAEKMAARGKVAAKIGHELNNLLSGIYGNLEIGILYVQREESKEKVLNHLNKVAEMLTSMTRFSQGLMDNTQMDTKLCESNLNDVVHSFIEFVKPVYRRTKATFEEKYDNDIPLIYLDRGQIQQILYNLTKNAIEVEPQSHITIETRFKREEGNIELLLSDNGPGMKKEKIDKLFTPLFTDKSDGHGYGLSICQAIVKNHSGSIKVESEFGEGTTFIITIPILQEEIKNSPDIQLAENIDEFIY